MEHAKTALNIGALIRAILLESDEVKSLIPDGKIFPLVTDETSLPYILYRRGALSQSPVKSKGGPSCYSVTVEVHCFAESYSESLAIANAVVSQLDGVNASWEGLRMRSCTLTDAEETCDGEAVDQILQFEIKI